MSPVPTLMIQGTSSHAGKSMLVAGLCRLLTRRGYRVRPFKPQNMSNNAAVTADGGEIGRAQALQARACRVAPSIHMNPVLLKPTGEVGAQVIVQGRVTGNASAGDYHRMKPALLAPVLDSYRRLAGEADLVLVEGAGSPAEANLRDGDIANMGFALAAEVPVVLVGDIERGGVLAQLVGTMALLAPEERRLVRGYVVNKLRGDPRLFADALPIIGAHTGLDCLGVLPYLDALRQLPSEDVLGLDDLPRNSGAAIRIAVPRLPRIANFDDLDPLAAEPDVDLVLVEPGDAIPGDCDLVVLPGSKATIADLVALRAAGFDIDIHAHVRRGGWVLGLCGGYQMLGQAIADPDGIEGKAGEIAGLGHLPVTTVLDRVKQLGLVRGRELATGECFEGYEIHLGRTTGAVTHWLRVDGRMEGAIDRTGRIMGTYVHGLLASDGFRQRFLGRLRARAATNVDYEARVEAALDRLAEHLERHLDIARIEAIARRLLTTMPAGR